MHAKDFIAVGVFGAIMFMRYGVAALMGFMPDWILPVPLAACFLSGIAGARLGLKTCARHFARAGLAA